MAYTSMRVINNEYLVMLRFGLEATDAPQAHQVHSMFVMRLPHNEPKVNSKINGMNWKDQP
jgi:hypothetical protein